MVRKNPSTSKRVTSKISSVPLYKLYACYSLQVPSQTTLPCHSAKQLISTHPVTHKARYQRPYSDTPLRNSVLGTLLTQQRTQKGCFVHNSTGRSFVCGNPALSYRHYRVSDKYTVILCAILNSASGSTVPSRCAESPFVDSNSFDCNRHFAESVFCHRKLGKLVAFCCVPWPCGGARQRSTLGACVTSRTQNKFVTWR
jgi:hypothetical protein